MISQPSQQAARADCSETARIEEAPRREIAPAVARAASLRSRVLLLGLLACGLVSGVSGTTAPVVPNSALESLSSSGPTASVWIDARLEAINPTLDARTRARIAAAVSRYSSHYGLDPELVTAVIEVESDARPWALSPKGAVGLMQVMPYMIEPLAFAGNSATIESNVEAGCRILADNIRRLGETKGISAYFWGNRIRDLAYLERVQAARAEIRRSNMS